jgi:hypothetical protein
VVLLSKVIVLLLKLIVLLFRRFLHDILDDVLLILCFPLDLRLLDHLLGLADDLGLLRHREGTDLLRKSSCSVGRHAVRKDMLARSG